MLPDTAFSDETPSANKENSSKEEVHPFNNMVRKFISLADDVIADKKNDTTTASTTAKTADTPATTKEPSKENNSLVSITSPEANTATQNQPATANQANSITPVKIDTPHLQEEMPNVEELKIPDPQTDQPKKAEEKKEPFIQRILESELKKHTQKDGTPVQKTYAQPTPPAPKKKKTTKTDKSKDGLSTEKTSATEIIRKSSEPYPTQRPESYKTQRLPDAVSKKTYSHENEHLPKAVYNEEYKKILFDSAASGNLDVLRAMVDNFGDTEVLDELGDTPLIYATMAGKVESALTLAGMGANVNAQNSNGVSSLYAATTLGRIDLVKLMLARSADPELANKNDKTPLMVAAEMDFSNIAYLLLNQGANVNRRMKNGNTALHLAALKNSVATLNLLLVKGADIDMRNFTSYTPLMLAAENDCEQATALLINAGADISKTTPQGLDVEAIAKSKGNLAIVQLIASEKIRQNMLAQKIIADRKNKIISGELEKPIDSTPTEDVVAKRVRGIPTPILKPEKTQATKFPKPSFSKEEIEKMKQSGL